MPSIYAYRKYIDPEVIRELRRPLDPSGQHLGTELATLDGITYVSLPDGSTLPEDQPAEIADSITAITLTPALIDAIKAASPLIAHINREVEAEIAQRYPPSVESKLFRTHLATGMSNEFAEYNVFAEECRARGREKKAALGLA